MHTPLFPTPTRPDPGPARIHIDTETLSIEPDAAIISIGAVLFMPGRTDPSGHFSCNIDFADALRHGRADGNTIAWWFKQPEATRLATLDNPVSLENALTQLNDWIDAATARIEPGDPIEYMANGPAFDFVALRNAYQRVLGKPTPWKYWAERDYRTERDQLKRTLAHLGLDTSEPERIDAHNALSDAMHQGTVIATLENRLFAGQSLLTSFWRTETDYQTAHAGRSRTHDALAG
jgi:hypothetical protein